VQQVLLSTTHNYWVPREDLLETPDSRYLLRAEVEALAALYWPSSEAEHAVRLALTLSQNRTGRWNLLGVDRRGLWQIDVIREPELAAVNLFDPMLNAQIAAEMWYRYGWDYWPLKVPHADPLL
jgi:hypothetical protein